MAATVSLVASCHKNIGDGLLLGLIVLHLLAIAYYFFYKRQNLITAMVTGDKAATTSIPPSKEDTLNRYATAMVFALCVSLVS